MDDSAFYQTFRLPGSRRGDGLAEICRNLYDRLFLLRWCRKKCPSPFQLYWRWKSRLRVEPKIDVNGRTKLRWCVLMRSDSRVFCKRVVLCRTIVSGKGITAVFSTRDRADNVKKAQRRHRELVKKIKRGHNELIKQ